MSERERNLRNIVRWIGKILDYKQSPIAFVSFCLSLSLHDGVRELFDLVILFTF